MGRKYIVSVRITVMGEDEDDARSNLIGDLDYLVGADSSLVAYEHPALDEVIEESFEDAVPE